MKVEHQMPKDWSNAAGWENYYAGLIDGEGNLDDVAWRTGYFSPDQVTQLAAELKNAKVKTIWIPGCGVSLLPSLLSNAGFTVHATDISQIAVDFQLGSRSDVIDMLLQRVEIESNGGSLVANVHDFQTEYEVEFFDLVINVKAIQGFNVAEMKKIAFSHFRSLKSGKQAIFDTMNVQGELRENLEYAVVNAGFFLPFYELNLQFRRSLNETGFPYVFVLGQPFIPRSNEYEDDAKWNRDMNVLRKISADFNEKRSAEQERVKAYYEQTPEAITATIIYSTG